MNKQGQLQEGNAQHLLRSTLKILVGSLKLSFLVNYILHREILTIKRVVQITGFGITEMMKEALA